MRFAPVFLLAVIGASAHPSGHKHLHRAAHEHQLDKKDVYVTATIEGKVVSWTIGVGSPFKAAQKPTSSVTTSSASSTTVAEVAAATTKSSSSASVAAATSSKTSTGSTSSATIASTYVSFSTCSSKKAKRATTAQIAYTGNTGTCGYGTNIKLIDSSIADKYTYVVKAVNGGSTMQCKVWNKIGPSGGINGFFNGNEASAFTLAAGSSQYIAFDNNTQGGMCCAAGSIALNSVGEFNCPWLEFDFGNESNNGWSGFDASALVEGASGTTFAALKACTADNSICSTLDGTGSGTNAFLPGDEAKDGIGGNLPAGSVSLVATWS